MKVSVFWNLHKKMWSIRHKDKVIDHKSQLVLVNCKFVVQPGGRDRVRLEKRKYVHAFVVGEWHDSECVNSEGEEVGYNPFFNDTFIKKAQSITHFDS